MSYNPEDYLQLDHNGLAVDRVNVNASEIASHIIDQYGEALAGAWHLGDGEGGEIIRRVVLELLARGLVPDPVMPAKPARKKTPKWLREETIAKHGLNCHYCKKRLKPETATVDHVIPVSKGGKDSVDNTVIACRSCNSKKGNKCAGAES